MCCSVRHILYKYQGQWPKCSTIWTDTKPSDLSVLQIIGTTFGMCDESCKLWTGIPGQILYFPFIVITFESVICFIEQLFSMLIMCTWGKRHEYTCKTKSKFELTNISNCGIHDSLDLLKIWQYSVQILYSSHCTA